MFSFLSIEFALLFIGFFALYWAFYAKPQIQNLLLLIISYVIIYLMAGVVAPLILLVFSVLIFMIAQRIVVGKHKKAWFIFGIVATILNLSIFNHRL